jgi:hypothetical protein
MPITLPIARIAAVLLLRNACHGDSSEPRIHRAAGHGHSPSGVFTRARGRRMVAA